MESVEFGVEANGNVTIENETQYQIVKVLFEGQTRKMSGMNYLRSVFMETFSKLQIQ